MKEFLHFIDETVDNSVLLTPDLTILELSMTSLKKGESPRQDGLPFEFY